MYSHLAPIYNYFVDFKARLAFEMPFILKTLESLGKDPGQTRVLDTACGTGQHAIAISQAGYDVSGSDLFPEMVSIAKINADLALQKISFKALGLGYNQAGFSDEPPFDAALCLGNSLPHVESQSALQEALADFYALLNPGGLLLLQMRNFDLIVEEKRRWMSPQAHQSKDEEYIFFRFYDFLEDGKIDFNMLTLKKNNDQPWQTTMTSTKLFPILSTNLKTTLLELGFKSVDLFGSLDGREYQPLISDDLIVIARK